MKFKIRGIREPGNLEKERVVIESIEDGDIGKLILTSAPKSGIGVSSKIKSPYWIPDTIVKKGDLIVVYTKKGNQSNKENNDGTSSYFFYIGSNAAFYSKEDETAVVFSISNWEFSKRP